MAFGLLISLISFDILISSDKDSERGDKEIEEFDIYGEESQENLHIKTKTSQQLQFLEDNFKNKAFQISKHFKISQFLKFCFLDKLCSIIKDVFR